MAANVGKYSIHGAYFLNVNFSAILGTSQILFTGKLVERGREVDQFARQNKT